MLVHLVILIFVHISIAHPRPVGNLNTNGQLETPGEIFQIQARAGRGAKTARPAWATGWTQRREVYLLCPHQASRYGVVTGCYCMNHSDHNLSIVNSKHADCVVLGSLNVPSRM